MEHFNSRVCCSLQTRAPASRAVGARHCVGPTLLSGQIVGENSECLPIDEGVGTVRLRNSALQVG
jgi:hypothetical protein